MDPKYSAKDGRFWHNEGNYFLPDDEPLMIFRGKDELAVKMCEVYIETLKSQPQTEIIVSHIETATERLAAFKSFHMQYPERVGVCCSVSQKAA